MAVRRKKKEPDPELVLAKLDEIEAEMRAIGFWRDKPSSDDPGFAVGPLEEWLQFVFLPLAREKIRAREWPEKSQVGVRAMREWDYHSTLEKALRLVTLCHEFDALALGRKP